jgi:hypothetical protein
VRGWVFVGYMGMADLTAGVAVLEKGVAQLKFELQRSFYSGVCSGIEAGMGADSDDAVLRLAAYSQFPSTEKRRAHAFYRHYRDGRAIDMPVSLREMFTDDPKLLAKIKGKITSVLRGPVMGRGGVVPVKQGDFADDDLAQDWRMSIGSFNLQWRALSVDTVASRAMVEVWFSNVYRWHPKVPRVSQCVHEAAERLKVKGAKDFTMVSDKFTIEVSFGLDAR